MRILTRYILREVNSHALIGAAIFTFVLFTRDLGRILELVVRASAPLPSVAAIFFYTVPFALTYTIPMSVLVGILIGLSRLAADSEITAMRASGMGVWSFGRVLAIFVAAAWALALLNSLYLAPWSLASLGHLEDQLKGSQVSYEVQPRVFYEGFPKLVLYVQDVHSAQGGAVWKDVFLADISDAANPRITLAREGILVPEGRDRLHLHLSDGSTHETDPGHADHYQISSFQQTDMNKSNTEPPAPGRCTSAPPESTPPRHACTSLSFITVSRYPRRAWCWRWSESLWDSRRRRAASRAGLCSRLCWSLSTTLFLCWESHWPNKAVSALRSGPGSRTLYSLGLRYSCCGKPSGVRYRWRRSGWHGSATRRR
jgi:lipopolysaccharide export LptBFGC system permease protein LptF